MPTRIKFDESLKELYLTVVKMGSYVESALRKAMNAFVNQDSVLADQIINEDEEINSLHLSIEDQCISLIAREQPVAHDLREIMTSTKVASNLERIGDHAVHLAKITKRLADRKYTRQIDDFQKMADVGITMLHNAVDVYLNQDSSRAREVSKDDDTIDDIHDENERRICELIAVETGHLRQWISYLTISMRIERLADHVTNVAKDVIYLVEGEIVRHKADKALHQS